MRSLLDYISEAEKKKVALGHFNISDVAVFRAVVKAAKDLNLPVVIGVSEGERDFLGVAEVAAMVHAARKKLEHPIFLNADHTYSVERALEACDAGFDAVIFDGAKLPFEENVERTRAVVKYARKRKSLLRERVVVEGELGYIGSSSKLLDAIPEGAAISPETMTSPEEAVRFVKATGVNLLAPAVGNIHGMLGVGLNPNLDIPRVSAIRKSAAVPLVLHGGSGTKDADFVAAIKAGISLIHISTELRVAWRKGLEDSLKSNPKELAPYKLFPAAETAVSSVIVNRLKLFQT